MKIFVISFQRTATTSTGEFFKKCGYKVADWKINRYHYWTQRWFEGNYESIFKTEGFINNQVFEDDPWWCGTFYKYIFHKIPNSYFILIERDSDKWFDSMLSHSKGKTLGSTYVHSHLYNREMEYNNINSYDPQKPMHHMTEIDNLLPLIEEHRDHYKNIYTSRNIEVKRFFERNDNSRLINVQLEDPNKWDKIANFFNIDNYPKETWLNKSK